MSNRILTEVFDMTLPPSEKIVLLAIADNADTETRTAYPGISYLARKSSQSRATVYRAIASLKKAGRLERYKDAQDRYTFRIPEAEEGQSQFETPSHSATKASQSETDLSQSENRLLRGTPIEPPVEPKGDLFEVEGEPIAAGAPAELFAHHLPITITGNTDAMIGLGQFAQNRREQKAAMTPTAIRRLCSKIKAWPPEIVAEAVGQAIDAGWKTLFDPRERRDGKQAHQVKAPQEDAATLAEKWGKV